MATEKKDAHVHLSDPAERAKVEATRGITRDAEGKIVRSKEWHKARLVVLDEKEATYKARLKNIQALRKASTAAMAAK